MRVLLVDDSPYKMRRLRDYLRGPAGLGDEEVALAQTAQDARRLLGGERFDVLVLDVALPARAGDEPSAETSLALLDEIAERDTLHRPGQVIGTTAYGDLAERTAPHYSDRLWTLLRCDETSDDWLEGLGRAIAYVKRRETERPAAAGYTTDACILTALDEPEMQAVHALRWEWQPPEPLDDSTFVRRAAFRSGDRTCAAVTASAPRMGMVASALLAAKLIERFRPRILVMAGICAGVAGKVELGDPILAETSWDWQSGKRVRSDGKPGFDVDPHLISVPGVIAARAAQLRADGAFWDAVRRDFPGLQPSSSPKFRIAPVSSGSAVLADGALTAEIKTQKRSMAGVEMEIYGVYAAAEAASAPRPAFFAVKSVCDFADENKNDDHRTYAAYTSARTVQEFLERYMRDLAELAGA